MGETDKSTIKKKKAPLIIGISVAAVIIPGVIFISAFIVFFINASSGQKVQQQLDLGEKYITELDYDNAIVVFQAVIEIDPKCEDAYIRYADVRIAMADQCIQQSDYDGANDYYEDALLQLNNGYELTESESMDNKIREIESLREALVPEEQNINALSNEILTDEETLYSGSQVVSVNWWGNEVEPCEVFYSISGNKIQLVTDSNGIGPYNYYTCYCSGDAQRFENTTTSVREIYFDINNEKFRVDLSLSGETVVDSVEDVQNQEKVTYDISEYSYTAHFYHYYYDEDDHGTTHWDNYDDNVSFVIDSSQIIWSIEIPSQYNVDDNINIIGCGYAVGCE